MENAPELEPGLELYWVAFCELGTCRAPSMGSPASIPWTAITMWADRYELSERQYNKLQAIIRRLDKWMVEEFERKNPSGDKPGAKTVRKTDGRNRRSWGPKRRRSCRS